jgi:hypothetical protein
MDVGTLAHQLTEALTPILPVLVTARDTITENVTKTASAAVVEWASRAWAVLRRPQDSRTRALETAAHDIALEPLNADARAAFRLQIRKILEADPKLAAELTDLIETGHQTGILTTAATGARSVAASGGIIHSIVVTGDNNTLR